MGARLKKVADFLLGVEEEDYEDEYYDDYEYEEPASVSKSEIQNSSSRKDKSRGTSSGPSSSSSLSSGNVRSIGSGTSSNVVDLYKRTQIDISAPQNIEDARDIIDNIKTGVISVVNLEGVESPIAQRIADFLSGSVDALDGNIRRLSHDMFVITPNGVEISGDNASDIDESVKAGSISLPWLTAAFR